MHESDAGGPVESQQAEQPQHHHSPESDTAAGPTHGSATHSPSSGKMLTSLPPRPVPGSNAAARTQPIPIRGSAAASTSGTPSHSPSSAIGGSAVVSPTSSPGCGSGGAAPFIPSSSQLRSSSGLTQVSSSSSLRSAGSAAHAAAATSAHPSEGGGAPSLPEGRPRTLSGSAEIRTEFAGGIQMELASPMVYEPHTERLTCRQDSWGVEVGGGSAGRSPADLQLQQAPISSAHLPIEGGQQGGAVLPASAVETAEETAVPQEEDLRVIESWSRSARVTLAPVGGGGGTPTSPESPVSPGDVVFTNGDSFNEGMEHGPTYWRRDNEEKGQGGEGKPKKKYPDTPADFSANGSFEERIDDDLLDDEVIGVAGNGEEEEEDNLPAPGAVLGAAPMCDAIGGGSMLLAGWVTAHKQGILNRTVRRWMALREMHLLFFTKPFGEEVGCYHLYLAKVENPAQSSKLFISGAFLPKGMIEVTTSSLEDAQTWKQAVTSTIEKHSSRDVKPVLNKTVNNSSFVERQRLREAWLSEHLSEFYTSEVQDRSVDVDKVVQAFVFHELRLYMRMIGRYSNRSADLDFLLDPPEDTLPHSSDAFLKDDVAEVMWRYHWLEGHLASFFQQYEPDQRKEASRIAAVHLGREDSLRCKLLATYPNCNPDTQFLLDAPTMDSQGWRYSTESLVQSMSALSALSDDENLRRQATGASKGKAATTILPNAFERWTASLSQGPSDPEAQRKRNKCVRFNLDPIFSNPTGARVTDASPTRWFGKDGFATSIKQLLRMGRDDSKIR